MTAAATKPCTIELTGPVDGPVVLALGGISSSRHVTSTRDNPVRGWWSDVVGDRLAIDTQRFRVAGADYIASDYSDVSTYDQARAIAEALDDAGIQQLHAVVGASYGGMVALALASLDADRVERLIVIGAAHESSAFATAQRLLQRKIVELGIRTGAATEALEIARGCAMTTYSSPDEYALRNLSADAETRLDKLNRFLTLAGRQFAQRCSPERFLSLSRSLDLHCVDPQTIRCRTTLIGVEQDSLVPPSQLRELASRITGPCTLELVSSVCAHDTFLADHELIAPIVERALQSLSGIPS